MYKSIPSVQISASSILKVDRSLQYRWNNYLTPAWNLSSLKMLLDALKKKIKTIYLIYCIPVT